MCENRRRGRVTATTAGPKWRSERIEGLPKKNNINKRDKKNGRQTGRTTKTYPPKPPGKGKNAWIETS